MYWHAPGNGATISVTEEDTPPHGEKAGLTYRARLPGRKVDRR